MQVQLDDKNVVLHIDDSVVEWFVENGYSKSMGARPMGRLIQEKLKKPLAEDILFGKLSHAGGEVFVTESGGNIKFRAESKANEKQELITREEN